MKNIINKTLIVCLSLFVLSCTKTEDVIFEGDTALQFSFGTTGKKSVEPAAVTAEAVIDFGTLKAVSGTHQVKLVFDAAKSTAVEGVNFTMVNGGVAEITAGQSMGQFKIKVLESGSTPIPKVAVFHLSSATLPLASFNQDYALTMALKCPPTTFVGGFNNINFFYGAGQYLIEEVAGEANTMQIVDYPDTGLNFKFKYDDDGVVSYVEQPTGYIYSAAPYAGKEAYLYPNANQSTVDMCGRVLTLKGDFKLFGTNAGWFNKTETFTGF